MGNCFRKKSNKVAPDPSQSNDDVSVIISSNTQFRPSPTAVRYGDMEEELKKGEEMVSYLDRGQDAKVAISGVAFDVTFDDKPSNLAVTPRRLPPLQTKGSSNAVSSGPAKKKTRKTTRQSEASQSDDVVIYTASEKELIAGILHDDFINERKQRARKLQNWKLARKAEDERTDEQHDDRTDASAVEEDTKVTYTASEKELIAGILHDDFIKERKQKSRKLQNWKLARKAEDEKTDEQHDDRTDASAVEEDTKVTYTASEKELIAGILHDDFIKERKQKARKLQNWKLARKAEDERTDEQHDDRTDASAVEEDTKVTYTTSEKELIAGILHDDFIKERKQKARKLQNWKLARKAEDEKTDEQQASRTEASAGEEEAKITYTQSEDQLIAEIMREDFLAERKARARRCQTRRCNQDNMDNG
ncbi:uncharacterized protein LOC128237858 [Mya arenaria]|uniref:uncharacterized protein LOC128237858 n=1 Tax=Mya arenaria TaxID=6604 RepID=UPI0022E10F1F|nr:uncharacterized protein LOC128237858 [Mya arenaria]